ncbi:MAG: hypothetical protein R3246_03705 [Acidimicrobiia bacterium]|nr:hypothetical protein [Acidimicrobiia bacterium]
MLPDHLDGWQRRTAQVAWVSITLAVMGFSSVGFVRAFDDPLLVALPPLTDMFVEFGWDFRVMISIALLAPFLAGLVIAWIVFWRRPDDPMALIFTMAMVMLHTYASRNLLTFAADPVFQYVNSVVFGVGMVALAFVFAYFPDGRAIPSQARWLPMGMLALVLAFPDGSRQLEALLQGTIDLSARDVIFVFAWSALFLAGLGSQIHRYRRVSGSVERQQTKWVMAPLGLSVLMFVVILALPVAVPATGAYVGWGLLVAVIPLGIAIPVGFGSAVLRYRLYDIDHVVSRTVSYLVVIALLGGVYALGVVGVGRAVAVMGGADSQLAVAASVLLTVAAFRPLRVRVQRLVDRRFNRSGFRSRETVDEFLEVLGSEFSVHRIQEELAETVAVAFEPSHAAVWLAEDE